jgi:hypothetical protein
MRLLKPGGRLLFTNPATVTGPLSSEEIAVRSSAGFFLFVPKDYDKDVIAQSGLRLLVCRDDTANMAAVAEKRARPVNREAPPCGRSKVTGHTRRRRTFLQ